MWVFSNKKWTCENKDFRRYIVPFLRILCPYAKTDRKASGLLSKISNLSGDRICLLWSPRIPGENNYHTKANPRRPEETSPVSGEIRDFAEVLPVTKNATEPIHHREAYCTLSRTSPRNTVLTDPGGNVAYKISTSFALKDAITTITRAGESDVVAVIYWHVLRKNELTMNRSTVRVEDVFPKTKTLNLGSIQLDQTSSPNSRRKEFNTRYCSERLASFGNSRSDMGYNRRRGEY
ncbi:hypothetical protein OPQ81_001026 [Rhizoctonia solani]|nr:hypothetical protein OPQ81_001026 [Rhizoctonia solani]